MKHRNEAQRRELVRKWRSSGQSVARFAKRHGIGASTLYEWSRKFSADLEPAFAAVTVVPSAGPQPPNEPGAISVAVGDASIEVLPGFDAGTLRRVIEVLRAC